MMCDCDDDGEKQLGNQIAHGDGRDEEQADLNDKLACKKR